MKKIVYVALVLIFAISLTSCGSTVAVQELHKTQDEATSFTIKDKKEVMQKEIFHKRRSTIIAQP